MTGQGQAATEFEFDALEANKPQYMEDSTAELTAQHRTPVSAYLGKTCAS